MNILTNLTIMCIFSSRITYIFFVLFFLSLSKASGNDLKKELIRKINTYRSQEKTVKKDSVYINLLNKLSWELKYANFDSVLLLCDEALALSKNINFKRGEANALLNLTVAGMLSANNKYKTPENLERAIQLAKEIKADSTLLKALNIKAHQKLSNGDYQGAYKIYNEALPLSKKVKDTFFEITLNTNLATLFLILGDTEEAIPFYLTAIKLSKASKYEKNRSIIESNLGYLYVKTGELDKALELLNRSIEVFDRTDSPEWLSFALITKGDLLLKENKPKEALEYFERSKKSHENLQDLNRKTDLLSGIATSYWQLKDLQNAQIYALEGLKIAKRQEYQAGMANISQLLYKIHKEKNENDLALKYLEDLKNIQDSTALIDKKNALLILKTKNEFKKEQSDLKLKTNLALAKQQTYSYFSLVAFILAILVSLYIYKKNNLVRKLNKDLIEKTQFLEEHKKSLIYANETQEKLFSIISHDLKSPINNLKGLLFLLKDGAIEASDFLNFAPKLYQDVDAMSFILHNVLSWGKSQLGGFKNFPTNFLLKENSVKSTQILLENAHQKNILIENFIPENAEVLCDINQFNIVIRNLVNNAIKFTHNHGKIVLSAKDLQNKWQITVTDNGIGISKETLKTLFEEDAVLKSTYGTNNEKGTGLGLLLSKEMIENNHGEIYATSTEGEGTSFHFTLPKSTKE